MKNKISSVLILTLLAFAFYPIPFADAAQQEGMKDFKVIGYYSGDLFDIPVEKLPADKLTHVIYAFLIPRADGSLVDLEKPEKLEELITQAHNHETKVFIALGGYSYQNQPLAPVFEKAAASPATRKHLVDNTCTFVDKYQLDGVELDWEHPNASSINNYESLVAELKTALDLRNKELTAALNGAWSATESPKVNALITDTCLQNFSFINVMAYDMNNDNHSPRWFAETSIDYWRNRGVPAEDIVLGMPLYARPSWLQYKDIVAQNQEYAYLDYAPTLPMESYYNSINTLREKTLIAMNKAGGVMLFDVNEDTSDETSIVSMINDIISRTQHLSKDELQKYITVIIDRQELVFAREDGIPFIDANNRTMIPVRKPLEAIGASLSYDPQSQTVTARRDETIVTITVGQNIITVNQQELLMDSEAVIKDNRVYIPLREVMAAFGYNIEWHSNSKTIILENPELSTVPLPNIKV